MFVTLSGIVIDVKPEHPEKALLLMLITGQPPSVDGMVIDPDVLVETARLDDVPPPTDALPSEMVYVHVMPFTTCVSA